jgi:hypothetical protein
MILFVQRGEHEIEHELAFSSHYGYIFHDSRGFEAGEETELRIVQDFVLRRSQEQRMNNRLHAIWFVRLATHSYKLMSLVWPVQVLHSDGQRSTLAEFEAFLGYLSR